MSVTLEQVHVMSLRFSLDFFDASCRHALPISLALIQTLTHSLTHSLTRISSALLHVHRHGPTPTTTQTCAHPHTRPGENSSAIAHARATGEQTHISQTSLESAGAKEGMCWVARSDVCVAVCVYVCDGAYGLSLSAAWTNLSTFMSAYVVCLCRCGRCTA